MHNNVYLSVKQIVESKKYPFTMGQLRHYLHHRHRNGLQKSVRQIGKQLLINSELFEVWVDSHTSNGGVNNV